MRIKLRTARLRLSIHLTGLRGTNVALTVTRDWAGVGNIGSKEFAIYSNLICKVDDKLALNAPRGGTEIKQRTRFIYLGLVNIYYDTAPKPPLGVEVFR